MADHQPRAVRRLLLAGVPAIVIAAAAYVHTTGGRYITTENAYVKAHVVRVSPEIDGEVAEVRVANNQRVEKGELLFRLADARLKLDLAVAEAGIDAVRQELTALKARFRQERAELKSAEEQIRYFKLQFERQRELKRMGAGNMSKMDEAEHKLRLARRNTAAHKQRTGITLSSLGGDLERPVARHARYRSAVAKRDRAALNLAHATVRAPMSGTLSNVVLRPGEYIKSGRPVLALVSDAGHWVEANLKEVHLTNVRVGQNASIVIDAYPDFAWVGRVESISPTTGAEFALLPPQNATGNWVKVVQRVPVRLAIEVPPGAPTLRVGMTAYVAIDTGVTRGHQALAATLQPSAPAPSVLTASH